MASDLTVEGITCTKCRHYSTALRRCLQGRCLPKNFKECVITAKLLGIGSLCSQLSLETHKRILERMRAA